MKYKIHSWGVVMSRTFSSFASLSPQIRCLKGQRRLNNPPTFDQLRIVSPYIRDDESYHSSDDDTSKNLLCGGPSPFASPRGDGRIVLHPNLADTDSDEEEEEESLRLSVPPAGGHAHNGHKTTSV